METGAEAEAQQSSEPTTRQLPEWYVPVEELDSARFLPNESNMNRSHSSMNAQLEVIVSFAGRSCHDIEASAWRQTQSDLRRHPSLNLTFDDGII